MGLIHRIQISSFTDFIIGLKGKKIIKTKLEASKNNDNQKKVDFFRDLDGNFRFLHGTFVCILFFTVFAFICYALIENLEFGKPMIECIKESSLLAMGTSIVFLILNIFCIFIVSNCFERFEKQTQADSV